MSSSKRERYDRKEGKDNLRVDAYDPQIDPDLYRLLIMMYYREPNSD